MAGIDCGQHLPTASTLAAGERREAAVDARCAWNRTGVLLEAGAQYRVGPALDVVDWRDKDIQSDPFKGWDDGPFYAALEHLLRFKARHRGTPMYALVGTRGKDEGTAFRLQPNVPFGHEGAPAELLVFANDWPSRYGNNHGSLRLAVERLR